jgi:hypothetical protein
MEVEGMAFQGANVTALQAVAGACQKGAAAAGAVVKILKQVIAALQASASGPWVQPFIRSLEALVKMLEMIVQRLNEFAKLLSLNASEQVQASAATGIGSPVSSIAAPKPVNLESLDNVTAAVDAVNGLLDRFTESSAKETAEVPAVESQMSEPAASSSENPADTGAEKSSGGSAGGPNSPGSGGAMPAGDGPVIQKAQGSAQVHSTPLFGAGGAATNYAATTGGLSAGPPIPLESNGKGAGMGSVIGVGSAFAGLGGAGFTAGRVLASRTGSGDTGKDAKFA